MDKDYFFAPFGPTTVERHDPLFMISKTCCWWSGQSWPYATTQTLKAMANLLQNYKQDVVTEADYLKLLRVYARTHRKNGKPYIAEAANPDTGSWEGHDAYNHSEHYFHSGFSDLVITGLVGLRPRDDDVLEVHPLATGGVGLLRVWTMCPIAATASASSGTRRASATAWQRGCTFSLTARRLPRRITSVRSTLRCCALRKQQKARCRRHQLAP